MNIPKENKDDDKEVGIIASISLIVYTTAKLVKRRRFLSSTMVLG